MKLFDFYYQSPLGVLRIQLSHNFLTYVGWAKNNESFSTQPPTFSLLIHTRQQFDEYFKNQRKYFELPYNLEGSPFQKKVWSQTKKILFGQTAYYKDIANDINCKSAQAVGNALHANPLCLIIPCHRVISLNKQGGGYSGGIKIKNQLLQLELETL